MLEVVAGRRVTSTHPASELLVPYALGARDEATAQHVKACATCRSEVEELQETAGLLRGQRLLERRTETPDCLDELVVADFVEGRLDSRTRAPVVAHLLICARCRSVARAAGRALAEVVATTEVARRPWRRWSLPLGIAAAAAVALLLWPRSTDDTGDTPGLREPADTGSQAPMPIAPRASVARVDQFVWSTVPRVERYRLRLYNDEGEVLWTAETADTSVAVPDSVELAPRVTYFWKVEAQTEWQRWAASDLVEFRLIGPSR